MAFVKQYPHYLFTETAADAVQDEGGNWSDGETTRTFLSMCREEPDGRGTEYQVNGGEFIKATSLIQLPTTCPVVAKGERVIVTNDPEGIDVRISGITLNFAKTQLHSRLWV